MTNERTRYGDTLLLPTRELVGVFVALGLKPYILQGFIDATLTFATATDSEGTEDDV